MSKNLRFFFKETVWSEVCVPEELQEVVFEKIKNCEIKSANALFKKIKNDLLSHEIIDDTAVQMSVKQNDGFATIEVEDITGKSIFLNGNDF